MVSPILVVLWVFSVLALAVMVLRMVGSRILYQQFKLGDWLTLGASVAVILRIGLVTAVLDYGTNNMTDAIRATIDFTPEEIRRRTIGAKCVVINRALYTTYLWIQKFVLLEQFRKVFAAASHFKIVLIVFIVAFLLTYIAAMVSSFVECTPFALYWRVVPPPGTCVLTRIQLLTLGITNIITDFMLLLLPVPIILGLQTSWQRRLKACAICTLGIFIILITLVRLPVSLQNPYNRSTREAWSSTEMLAAAIVVNAPAITALISMRRERRQQSSLRAQYGGDESGEVSNPKSRRSRFDDLDDEIMLTGNIVKTEEVSVVELSRPPTLPAKQHEDWRGSSADSMAESTVAVSLKRD